MWLVVRCVWFVVCCLLLLLRVDCFLLCVVDRRPSLFVVRCLLSVRCSSSVVRRLTLVVICLLFLLLVFLFFIIFFVCVLWFVVWCLLCGVCVLLNIVFVWRVRWLLSVVVGNCVFYVMCCLLLLVRCILFVV